jgi:hypothetical protein
MSHRKLQTWRPGEEHETSKKAEGTVGRALLGGGAV